MGGSEPQSVSRVEEGERPDSLLELYEQLRERVLRGELAPGTNISQVQLARRYKISRAPLREVLRMLQSEGLIESQPGRRSRIAVISGPDLDQVYAQRIVLEALAVRLTAPRLQGSDLEELRALLTEMDDITRTGNFVRWEVPHGEFHERLVAGAGERVVASINGLADHAGRYRRILLREPRAWGPAADEHAAIVDALEAGDAHEAGCRLAAHYATTALTVCAGLAPEYEPTSVREALRMVSRAGQKR